jgi:hypothetical protein
MLASQDHTQPISQAAQVLRRPSDNDAIELESPDDFHFPRVDTVPNPNHGRFRQDLARHWNRHISMGVPHVACRDHLGKQVSTECYLQSLTTDTQPTNVHS